MTSPECRPVRTTGGSWSGRAGYVGRRRVECSRPRGETREFLSPSPRMSRPPRTKLTKPTVGISTRAPAPAGAARVAGRRPSAFLRPPLPRRTGPRRRLRDIGSLRARLPPPDRPASPAAGPRHFYARPCPTGPADCGTPDLYARACPRRTRPRRRPPQIKDARAASGPGATIAGAEPTPRPAPSSNAYRTRSLDLSMRASPPARRTEARA